jgi:hypothetical protein
MIASNEVDVDHAMVTLKLEPENFNVIPDKLRWTKTRSKGNQSNLKKRNKVILFCLSDLSMLGKKEQTQVMMVL